MQTKEQNGWKKKVYYTPGDSIKRRDFFKMSIFPCNKLENICIKQFTGENEYYEIHPARKIFFFK